MAVINSEAWPVVTQEDNMKKGKLIRVEIGPGRFVKMYEADAAARGLIPQKSKPPAGNKMKLPAGDKGGQAPDSEVLAGQQVDQPQRPDDLTIIKGVGQATARAIQARGITTFDQLRAATDLSFLTAQAQEAIEQWRENG